MADPTAGGNSSASAGPPMPATSQPTFQMPQGFAAPFPQQVAFPPAPQQQQQPQPQQPQPQTFPHYTHSAQQAEQLRQFWKSQMVEVENVGNDPAEFKNHQLPLARIKKIMKSDEDVRMISAEAPVLFAKACEMFILELTLRSWIHAEENKRRTLQRNDIAAAITKTDIFDFLVDIVPREETRPENEVQRPAVPPQPMPGGVPMPTGAPNMFYPYGAMPGVAPDPSMLARPPMTLDPTLMYQQQAFMANMQNQQWQQQAMPAALAAPAPQQPPAADAQSQK